MTTPHPMKSRTLTLSIGGFAFAVLLGFWAGHKRAQYHWGGSPRPSGITLATLLRQRGISPQSISYLRFIGDESSFTTGKVATNTTDVAWIWDTMIETAESAACSHTRGQCHRRD